MTKEIDLEVTYRGNNWAKELIIENKEDKDLENLLLKTGKQKGMKIQEKRNSPWESSLENKTTHYHWGQKVCLLLQISLVPSTENSR